MNTVRQCHIPIGPATAPVGNFLSFRRVARRWREWSTLALPRMPAPSRNGFRMAAARRSSYDPPLGVFGQPNRPSHVGTLVTRFSSRCRATILATLLVVVCGCSNTIRWPNFLHPGPVGYQRHAALFHDPYPVDDMGPEIVGGRPREYQRPIPEVERAPFAPPPIRPGYPWH